MMVPRAYSFSSGQQGRNGPPNSTRKAGTRPSEPRPTAKRTPTTSTSKLTTISPAAPSKPVVIPTRTKNDRRYSKARADAERASKDHGSPHDSEAVSPSVAAFLAIRPSSNSKQRSHTAKRHGQAVQDGFLQEASYNNLGGPSLSDLSPHSWRLLLSPPHDVEDEASSVGSGTTALVLRSFSSESMPSLDTDTESVYTSSSPSTPGLPRKGHRSQEKTSKSISSSVPEDCLSDHPLLPIQPEPENTTDADPTEGRLPGPTKLSFRSNLTASFRRLKSAAKTFSNIASPSTSRDESPTRASLSEFSKIASERRPLPWAEPPDPALRRYLNPFTVSPVELHTHRNHEESNRKPNYKASIQMQTYRPGPRKSDKASAPPVFAVPASQGDAADEPAISSASTPRQREPRENSDFLRVIVLEMNMRKVGKLSDVSPGRARLWLPARQPSAQAEEIKNETPRRWVSLSA